MDNHIDEWMSHMIFPTHTPDTAPADSRRAMDATRAKFGAVPTPVARMATSPTLLNGFLGASAAFEGTSLPPVAREVVVMTVAVRNDCHTCVALHGRLLERLGRADLVEPLRADQVLPERDLEAVRRLVHQIMDHAGAVPEPEVEAFLEAGYTAQDVLDIVFGIGVYTMSTYANRLLGA